MRTPPLLIGGSLLFWGWQVGRPLLALALAGIIEAARLVRWRRDFSVHDDERIVRICLLLSLGVMVTFHFSGLSKHPILSGLSWIPVALLPLVAAQEYSSSGLFVLGAFSWLPGTQRRVKTDLTSLNVAPLYAMICVAAASTANTGTFGFYAGMASIAGWILFWTRAGRASRPFWGMLFVAALAMGYLGQIGLHHLQGVLEQKMGEWFEDLLEDTDPYSSYTAIGDRGRLKLSDRIVLRVKPPAGERPPALLHEASYNRVSGTSWVAWESPLRAVPPRAAQSVWELGKYHGADRTVTICSYSTRGKGVLAMPAGAFKIEHLPVGGMKQNRLGTVRVEGCPFLLKYLVHYDPKTGRDAPPDAEDLEVPSTEAPVLERFLTKEGLADRNGKDTVDRLRSLFQDRFLYSLDQPASLGDRHADRTFHLERFLFDTRSGHCEYFATATVLLLRWMKLPARYATGYSVQEFSSSESLYVVRARHAHAWARVYLDGHWHDLDTTPTSWADLEARRSRWWQSLFDLCSRIAFRFSEWRWSSQANELRGLFPWVMGLVLVLAAWRLVRGKPGSPTRIQDGGDQNSVERPGLDSEFSLIVADLSKRGYPPLPGETLSVWLGRIGESLSLSPEVFASLQALLTLHHRYRFDTAGISAKQRRDLREGSLAWLSRTGLLFSDPVPRAPLPSDSSMQTVSGGIPRQGPEYRDERSRWPYSRT